jgi:cell division protein FtsW (lipid II flippase)
MGAPRQQLIEGRLLLLAAAFISLSYTSLLLALNRPWESLWLLGAYLLGLLFAYPLLNHLLPRHDPYLFPVVMLLCGWGLVIISRLVPRYGPRQLLWILLGLLVLLILARLPSHFEALRHYRYVWLGTGLGLLLLSILAGVNPSGAGPRLWLSLGGEVYFQPSELLKILLVIFLASYMADHQAAFHAARRGRFRLIPAGRIFAPIGVMWGFCLLLLIWQRDLGTAAIFYLVFLLMLYLASGQAWILAGGGLLLGLFAVLGYWALPIIRLRVDIWLQPWGDAENTSFQIAQSLMAIADGGLLGSGPGGGIPNFIPVAHTDFAFAALVEEWGLLGAAGLLICLLILIGRAFVLAARLGEKPFQAYLAAGLGILLAVQSLMILGGNLSLIPLTGVTLPFVSYGGSSLLNHFIALGLLLALSAEAPPHESALG